jgi:sulfite reductase beta subunit-like hemoprotein
VTHSRGLGRILAEHLASRPEIVARAGELDLKISGCPNGCGQHHVAGIGFQGSVRQVDGRPVPQYFVSVGGGLDTEGARFGRLVAKIPARRVADAAVRLLEHAARERHVGETTRACLQRADVAALRALLADLEAFDPARAAEEDYVDTGGEEEITLSSGRA